jgi:PKD repeat protein
LKKLLIVATAMLILVSTAACKAGTAESRNSGQGAVTGTYIASPPMTTSFSGDKAVVPAPSITNSSTPGVDTVPTSSSLPDDRMIVRTGNMSLVVDDIGVALADIAQIAEGYKGYVVSSNSWKDGERIYGSISIRVPAQSYDIASKSVSQMAVEVTSQSTSSQDVTEEYVDLTAQLSNLKATEQQLLSIMAKADKIADILAVQIQLTSIQSQIEQIQGRMQYLEKTSATSLLNVSLSQAKLEAKFSASSVNAKTGNSIQFYPDVAGGFTPYSYAWDFGDGKTSTDASPVHSFAKPGKFTISLKVTDDRSNTVTETREGYVNITQGGWSIGGVVSGAWEVMLWLGRGLLTILIGLLVFSPVLLVIGASIWWLRRRKSKTS